MLNVKMSLCQMKQVAQEENRTMMNQDQVSVTQGFIPWNYDVFAGPRRVDKKSMAVILPITSN